MMTRASIVAGGFATAFLLLIALVVLYPGPQQGLDPVAETEPAAGSAVQSTSIHPGFLYGRVTTVNDTTYEGRLRWGRDQEAFWSDYFNGAKDENLWAAHLPGAQTNKEGVSLEILGFEIGRKRQDPLDRQFMARFGDIARIDAHVGEVQVMLKSSTLVALNRFEASDIDDGVRVWDVRRGVVDLDARRIRTIEFRPTPPLAGVPGRLHGTVRTPQGSFTGFIQWNRQDGVGTDALDGQTENGDISLRYDTIRAIARRSPKSALVTLSDGRELTLSDTREVGDGHNGIYVDDLRYGRVLISWEAFERVDFTPGDSGLAYDDFSPGHALTGTVAMRGGRRVAGRLVYDFDESETTETLDAPFQGVDYTIPFRLIRSIVPGGREGRDTARATVILHHGEERQLERAGDLGIGNAGILIFVDGRERPEYVAWTDVERIDFDRAPAALTASARLRDATAQQAGRTR